MYNYMKIKIKKYLVQKRAKKTKKDKGIKSQKTCNNPQYLEI